MIFEEIINNEYKIISVNKQIQKEHRNQLKILLHQKKKFQEDKIIYLKLRKDKVKDIDISLSNIEDNIKEISCNYETILIQNI